MTHKPSTMLRSCALCPRRCGVDRVAGQKGFCRAGSVAEIFRWGPHHGEEPPLSGTSGSGAIFFSRCTLRCIYCQNYRWSQEGEGQASSAGRLAAMLGELAGQGCHNWNLVSPTPWLPVIREAVEEVATGGVRLPLVYNTSGYERPEILETFSKLIDIYLTDLRYADASSAVEGSGCPDYVVTARSALQQMWRQVGPLQVDAAGVAVKGSICRLLVLPGRAQEAVANLEWLAKTVGNDIAISVMSQYLPAYRAQGRGACAPWNRRPTRQEYDGVRAAVERLGFENGWVQDFDQDSAPDLVGYQMNAGG